MLRTNSTRTTRGGYFPYSFPRNRSNFLRACIFFDQVELCLPSTVELLVVPTYERKHLKTNWEALNDFLQEIEPLIAADVVSLVEPDRPEGALSFPHGEKFWWELGDRPFRQDPISEKELVDRLEHWWPVVATMNARSGLIPYTDDQGAFRWFANRLLAVRAEAVGVANEWADLAVGSSWLGLETMRMEAPNLVPQSIEHVMEIRERLSSELHGFRLEMAKLGARLAATPWEPSFSREVARVITADVSPALQELRERSDDIRKGLRWKGLSAVVRATPLPMVTTVLIGLPIEVGLALAAGVALGDVMAEYREARTQLARNGLALLLAEA